MPVQSTNPIIAFADAEIPDIKVRTKFLGIMLGMLLGRSEQRAARDHRVGKDDEVWSYIEKYRATRSLSLATEFAEQEISDESVKEVFLELAPMLIRNFDIDPIIERRKLQKDHPVWPLLIKYLKGLVGKNVMLL